MKFSTQVTNDDERRIYILINVMIMKDDLMNVDLGQQTKESPLEKDFNGHN